MSMGYSSREALRHAVIESAVIRNVYPDRKTCDVFCLRSHRDLPNIPYYSPMLHGEHGTGLEMCPTPESLCYVCTPADGTGHFILGYAVAPAPQTDDFPLQADEHLSYAAGRKPQNPGDLELLGPDGNFVSVLRGGIVQWGASPRAMGTFIPISNLLRLFYDRVQHMTPLGEFSWDMVERKPDGDASDEDTSTGVILKFGAREKIGQRKLALEVRMGRLDASTLDTALDSNLLAEGLTTSVTVMGETVASDEELPSGSGDREHIFGANMAHPQPLTSLLDDGSDAADGARPYDPDDEASGPPGILSVVLIDADDETFKCSFQLARDGTLFLRTEMHVHLEAKTFYVRARDHLKLELGTGVFVDLREYIRLKTEAALVQLLGGDVLIEAVNITLKASGALTLIGAGSGTMELEAENIVLNARGSEDPDTSGIIELGKGGTLDLLAGASRWRDLLDNHTHDPGTGLPVAPPTGSAPTTSNTATKVLVKG